MPKVAVDYSKTIIYKLVCNDLNINEAYVGHTTDWRNRKCAHKKACNNSNGRKYNFKVYQTIRANGGWENWSMIELESYPCSKIQEATSRERYWYETINSSMNMQYPGRSHKESKDELKKIVIHCECGQIFLHPQKARHLKKSNKHHNYLNSLNSNVDIDEI